MPEVSDGGVPRQDGPKQRKKRGAKVVSPKSGAKSKSKSKAKDLVGAARYKLGDEIGRGSMGIVYLARDLVADRDVAVKELSLGQDASEERRAEMVERFAREARATANIVSDNVVKVTDTFQDGERYCLVMEYLQGTTLEALIKKGPLPVEDAVNVTTHVLKGLAAAHAGGIVHRDLKPSNVFVLPDGSVKVTDFGVAHIEDGDAGLTRAGQVLGTLGYMSPEQVGGQAVDARADIFATGVMLFEMLVGANPFHADQPTTVMYRIAYEEPPALDPIVPGLPAHVQAILVKSLAKDPTLRYQSADAMLADLLSGTAPDTSAIVKAVAARAAESKKSLKKSARKPLFNIAWGSKAWIGVAVAVAIVVVGAVGGYAYWSAKQREEAARRVAVIREASAIVTKIAEVKKFRAELTSAIGSLGTAAEANRSALDRWDSVWQARQSAYDASYASVVEYNANQDELYTASGVDYYYTWTGAYAYTLYSYTRHYRSYPRAPKRPAKVKANLSSQKALLASLNSRVASLSVSTTGSASASLYFPVASSRLNESVSELKRVVGVAVGMAGDLVTTDSERGQVVDVGAVRAFQTSRLDTAIAAMDSELDLYLSNYKVSRSELKAQPTSTP